MFNGIKKKAQLSQSLPQRNNTRWILLECRDGSCYFNTQKIEFTYPPQKERKKKTTTELKLEKN